MEQRPDIQSAQRRVAGLRNMVVDDSCKGWPASRPPTRIDELRGLGIHALRQELLLPVAVLKEPAA